MNRLTIFISAALLLLTARTRADTVHPDIEDQVRQALLEMDNEDFHTRQLGVQHMLALPPEALVYLDRIISDNTESAEVIARVQENIERLRAKARQNAKSRRAAEIAEWEAILAAKGYQAGTWHNARWDSAVNDGFSRIASIFDGGNPNTWHLYAPAVFEPFQKAVAAGCEDPLVDAYYLRTGFITALLDDKSGENVLPHIFPRIMNSVYAPAIKFQAAIDFTWGAHFADPDGQLWTPTERWNALRTAADLWPAIVNDPTVPDVVLEELAGRFLDAAVAADIGRLQVVELLLNPWQSARPKTGAVWAFKTSAYLWSADAHLQDDTPRTDEELKTLTARIATAREAGEKAYAADPTDGWAPTLMIRVCNLDHADRQEMDQWYDRAIGADPGNLDACLNKLEFLAAHGEPDGLLQFGRECALKGNGRVPLALIRAHQLISTRLQPTAAEAYLKSADVWNEEQVVFKKFLAAHSSDPMGLYYRSLYAQYAAYAEQWSTAQEQFAILGAHPDINVFKSMSAYNYLRQKVQHAITNN